MLWKLELLLSPLLLLLLLLVLPPQVAVEGAVSAVMAI
jgi:hypothetical protein